MDSNKGIKSSHVDDVPGRGVHAKSTFPFQYTWLEPHTWWSKPIREATISSKGPVPSKGTWQTQVAMVTRFPAPTFPTYVF
jgi:hypothetical protein